MPPRRGSPPRSPPRPRRRAAPGTRSPRASTRSSPPRRAPARRSRRSSGRSTVSRPSRGREPGVPRPLRLAAEGARRRRRAEPARAAGRHPRRRGAPRARRRPRSRRRCAPATRPPRSAGGWCKHPPDILVTTPESLFLLLTSAARDTLRTRRDGHRRRGARRRRHQARHPSGAQPRAPRLPAARSRRSASACRRRCGRWRTSARFLGGAQPVTVVAAPADKPFDLSHRGAGRGPRRASASRRAGAERQRRGRRGAAPASGRTSRSALLELIRAHRSTIVFANSRRLAERLCARLNELAGEELARAHHGSVSREQRAEIEEALKRGPHAGGRRDVVARARHRHGRGRSGRADRGAGLGGDRPAAHRPRRPPGRRGEPRRRSSRSTAATCSNARSWSSACGPARSRRCARRATRSTCSRSRSSRWWRWTTGPSTALERARRARAAPFADAAARGARRRARHARGPLSVRRRSPSCARASTGTARRPPRRRARSAQRLAVTSGGTIPDRGLYGVFLAGERRPGVGELDEEMVYESRAGEVFLLGASSWRIEDITHDRVIVSPAPGQPGKMPFWRGDAPGPPARARRGARRFVRELRRAGRDRCARAPARRRLDEWAAGEPAALPRRAARGDGRACPTTAPSSSSASATRSATGASASTRSSARACTRRGRGPSRHGCASGSGSTVQSMYTDDGIVIRVPDADDAPPAEAVFFDPEEVEELVTAELGDSALFASRFRECAARALLLPRRRPGARTPLWQQRQRSAALLQVASRHPVVPDRARDLPRVPAGRLRPARAEPSCCAPCGAATCASSRSTPRCRRRSPARSSSATSAPSCTRATRRSPSAARRRCRSTASLLAELMGRAELRELLDADALAALELELQRLDAGAPGARCATTCTTCCATLGDLTRARSPHAPRTATRRRRGSRRWSGSAACCAVRVAGDERWIAAEDAARYRDALGVALPLGVPSAFLEPVADPLGDLVARYARTHGPFAAADAGGAVRARPRRGRAGAARARDGRPGRRGRVPARRQRPRVGRRGGAAPAAAALAGGAAARDRAGRAGAAGALRAWRGRASAPRPPAAARSTRCCAWSSSSRACRCRPRRSSRRSCPRAFPATRRCCSTSSAPRASWCGPAPARSAPTTAGSCWRRPSRRRCCSPSRPLEPSPLAQRLLDALGRRRRALLPPARRGRRRPATTPSWCWRCGSSCGRARHQRHAGAAARHAAPAPVAAARRTRRVARRVPTRIRAARRRRTLEPASRRATPDATRRAPRGGGAAAAAPRHRDARRGRRRSASRAGSRASIRC